MTNKTKVALGVLGALAAGVVVGLMIAPEKGSEMRKRIRRTTGTWVDGLGNLMAKGHEVADSAVENMKGLKDAAKEKVQKAKESMG